MREELMVTALKLQEQIKALGEQQDIFGTTINDFQVSENFNLTEFQCKGSSCCGNTLRIHPELVKRLQAMRSELGSWIMITSGYRCRSNNAKAGGSQDSQHPLGTAADIRAANMPRLKELAEKYFPDGGVGVSYANHIHVDVRGRRARW